MERDQELLAQLLSLVRLGQQRRAREIRSLGDMEVVDATFEVDGRYRAVVMVLTSGERWRLQLTQVSE